LNDSRLAGRAAKSRKFIATAESVRIDSDEEWDFVFLLVLAKLTAKH
jgi:hypothetical protein